MSYGEALFSYCSSIPTFWIGAGFFFHTAGADVFCRLNPDEVFDTAIDRRKPVRNRAYDLKKPKSPPVFIRGIQRR